MNFVIEEAKRLKNATGYSLEGLRHAWAGEAAFRFEAVMAVFMIPVACLLPVSAMEKLALVGTVLLVLIVELLNSAVEAVVDRVSSDHHPLSGQAKDLGSAAVFVSLILVVITWVSIGWTLVF